MIKILVIEPNLRSRRTLQDLLSFMGYAEEAAADCNEALVLAAEQHIDVIFVNGDVPAEDREKLRNLLFAAGMEIPMVVYAGTANAESMMQSAEEYLESPFIASSLNQKIKRVASRSPFAVAS